MRLTIIGKTFRCKRCGFWEKLAGFEQLGRCNVFPPYFWNASPAARSERSITNEDEFCGFYQPDLERIAPKQKPQEEENPEENPLEINKTHE